MLTICLDESGDFEERSERLRFIGGFIYRGDDSAEEELKLEEYLKKACEELKISYPAGLHTTDNRSYLNDKIKGKIVEYLQQRDKKYYFTCIINGKDGKSKYRDTNNIIDDREAGNLYENMSSELIKNLLYNSIFTDSKFKFNIATRVAVIAEDDRQKISQFEKLGYQSFAGEREHIFYLTGNLSFNTLISKTIADSSIEKDFDISLKVNKINYFKSRKDRCCEDTTPFLYLADIVVSLIREGLLQPSRRNSSGYSLHKLMDTARALTGNEPLVWVYDDLDDLWQLLNEQQYHQNLIESLEIIYEARNLDSMYRKFYLNNWIKRIENRLHGIFAKSKVELYLSQLKQILFVKGEYDKGIFIAEFLEKEFAAHGVSSRNMYLISDLLMSTFNHKGNFKRAELYFQQCRENRFEVGFEEYIASVNRASLVYANQFKFAEAINALQDSLTALNLLKERKIDVAGLLFGEDSAASNTGLKLLGKVRSSLGQYYAFSGEYQKSREYFLEALQEFENPSVDREITISYLLQLANSTADQALYNRYMREYYRTEDLAEQFDRVLKSQNKYALFVYLKSLNTIYKGQVSADLVDRIQKTDYQDYLFKTNDHPWELIYKHIALLLFRFDKLNSSRNFLDKAVNTVDNTSFTIKMINLYSELEFAHLRGDTRRETKKSKEMESLIIRNGLEDTFAGVIPGKKFPDKKRSLAAKFGYMYV